MKVGDTVKETHSPFGPHAGSFKVEKVFEGGLIVEITCANTGGTSLQYADKLTVIESA